MALFDAIGATSLSPAVNQKIGESYGYLMSSETDMTPAITATFNLYKQRFLDLFKFVIDNHPSDFEDYIDDESPKYYESIIKPAMKAVNEKEYALNTFYNKDSNEVGDNFNVSFIDLDSNDQNVRISNPTRADLEPNIILTASPFIVDDTVKDIVEKGHSIQWPYVNVPLMAIHPSISSANRIGSVFTNEVKGEGEYVDNMNHHTKNKASLEISIKSLILSMIPIIRESDSNPAAESFDINNDGLSILNDTVNLWATIATALTIINLRQDANNGQHLVLQMYNKFCNSYQNAIVNQQRMFAITTTLFKSPCGKALLGFIASKRSVNTIDLITDSNYKYFLEDVLESHDDDSCEFSHNFTHWVATATEFLTDNAISDMISHMEEQRKYYARMIDKLVESFIDGILVIINTGNHKDASELFLDNNKPWLLATKIIAAIGCTNGSATNETSVLMSNIASWIMSSTGGNRTALIDSINNAISNKSNVTAIGSYSNARKDTPYERTYNDDFIRRRYDIITGNSASCEDADMELEVFHNKVSNAAMRDIATKCANITSFEECMSIITKTDKYLDLIGKSCLTTETAGTINFKSFMLNARNKTRSAISVFENDF